MNMVWEEGLTLWPVYLPFTWGQPQVPAAFLGQFWFSGIKDEAGCIFLPPFNDCSKIQHCWPCVSWPSERSTSVSRMLKSFHTLYLVPWYPHRYMSPSYSPNSIATSSLLLNWTFLPLPLSLSCSSFTLCLSFLILNMVMVRVAFHRVFMGTCGSFFSIAVHIHSWLLWGMVAFKTRDAFCRLVGKYSSPKGLI